MAYHPMSEKEISQAKELRIIGKPNTYIGKFLGFRPETIARNLRGVQKNVDIVDVEHPKLGDGVMGMY